MNDGVKRILERCRREMVDALNQCAKAASGLTHCPEPGTVDLAQVTAICEYAASRARRYMGIRSLVDEINKDRQGRDNHGKEH